MFDFKDDGPGPGKGGTGVMTVGLWSDNSVAMLGALFRIQFPLVGGKISLPKPITAPKRSDPEQLNLERHARE